jgi:hypothetical protein
VTFPQRHQRLSQSQRRSVNCFVRSFIAHPRLSSDNYELSFCHCLHSCLPIVRVRGEVVLAKMVQTVPQEIERRTLSRLSALGARESAMIRAGARRVRWFLVFWLFILSAVSYLDRANISIAGEAIVEADHSGFRIAPPTTSVASPDCTVQISICD